MVKAPKLTGNKGLIWAAWLLSTCGFAILLAGVASMQQACGGTTINMLTQGGGGTVGYLAPVSCNHFFQYTWWIVFLHFFTWLLVAAYLLANVIHKSRPALVGILAVASVLLMDTANTYLYFNYIPGLTGTMSTRTKVTVAGAIVAAVADMLLILLIGWADNTTHYKERGEYHSGTAYDTIPVGRATTTTTNTSPLGTAPVGHAAAV